jgi:hypothetical protein
MMMMSLPIQPNTTRATVPTNFGNQGFISGRKRLQQQAPTAKSADTPTYSNRKNQALVTTGNDSIANEAGSSSASSEAIPTQRTASPITPSPQRTNPNTLAYQEIQDIAEKAGYVGVSQRDIDRAYRLNKSLLVDYRA